MPPPNSGWEPDRHPVHRLIQLVDIIRAGVTRIFDKQFNDPPQQVEARKAYTAVCRVIRDRFWGGGGYTALAIEAIAHFAGKLPGDEMGEKSVGGAVEYIARCCPPIILKQTTTGVERSERPSPTDSTVMTRGEEARLELITHLSRIGEVVPREIVNRDEVPGDLIAAVPCWAEPGCEEERTQVTTVRVGKRDKQTEARDKWIYEQCVGLVAYDSIARGLKQKSKWAAITSKQGIYSAAIRYAKRHNLPTPPPRQSR